MMQFLTLAVILYGSLWNAENLGRSRYSESPAVDPAIITEWRRFFGGDAEEMRRLFVDRETRVPPANRAVGAGAGALIGGVIGAQQERQTSKDYRIPILPPIKAGERPTCDDPPSQAEVLRTISSPTRVPGIYEETRDDIEFTVERMADKIDPPQFFPLVGTAQLHHCHWKCTVYFTETVDSSYPFPFRIKRRRAEVVYIDRDRLHMVADKDSEARIKEVYKALTSPPQRVELALRAPAQRQSPKLSTDWDNQITHADNAFGPEKKLPLLTGRVVLLSADGSSAVDLTGTLTVTLFDVSADAKGVRLAEWKLDAATMKRLKKNDGYRLALPWEEYRPIRIRLEVDHVQKSGERQFAEPTVLTLQPKSEPPAFPIAPAQATQPLPPPPYGLQPMVQQATHVEPAQPLAIKQMTIDQIVRLSKHANSEEIILKQIELTASVFDLSTEQIISLLEQGVSPRIIRVMQERRGR